MPQIRWTKEDVIKKFQEAMTSPEPGTDQRPKVLQNWIEKAKTKFQGKPAEGEETV